jgi:hypothetical protein
MQFSNWSRRFRGSQSTVYTLAVLPPGADLWRISGVIRQDIEDMRNGFNTLSLVEPLKCPDGKVHNVNVFGAMGLLIADSIQAVETASHMGNKALRNSRNSWILKEQRGDTSIDIMDHKMTRRHAQTLVVREQIEREVRLQDLSATKETKARTKYGIDHFRTMWIPRAVDPHTVGGYEIHHLFDACYSPLTFRCTVRSMNNEYRDLFRLRLNEFDYPRAFKRPTLGWTKDGYPQATISWAYTRKLILATLVCACGLHNNDDSALAIYHFFCRFARWVTELSGPVPPRRYEPLHEECKYLVKTGLKVIGDRWGSSSLGLSFNRPNLVGLTEVVRRLLPMLGNCAFMSSSVFESHHKFLRETTGAGGSSVQDVAINTINDADSAAHLVRGCRFGDNAEYAIGASFTELRDPRPALHNRPHPLCVAVAQGWHRGFRGVSSKTVGRDDLHQRYSTLKGLDWTAYDVESGTRKLNDRQLKALSHAFSTYHTARTWPNMNSSTTYTLLSSVYVPNHCRKLILCIGDVVKCTWWTEEKSETGEIVPVTSPNYMRIEELVEVTTPNNEGDGMHTSLWAWPQWYLLAHERQSQRNVGDVERLARRKYKHLSAQYVVKDETRNMNYPVPVSDIIEQVLLTHACIPSLAKDGGMSHTRGHCYPRMLCDRHSIPECTDCNTSQKRNRYCHDTAHNPVYLVLGGAHGFSPEYRFNEAYRV